MSRDAFAATRATVSLHPEGYTVWSPNGRGHQYLEPSPKDFMVNLRVQNLAWLLRALKREGVKVLDHPGASFVSVPRPSFTTDC